MSQIIAKTIYVDLFNANDTISSCLLGCHTYKLERPSMLEVVYDLPSLVDKFLLTAKDFTPRGSRVPLKAI